MIKDKSRDLRHSVTGLTGERDKLQGEMAVCPEMVAELKAKLDQSGADVEQSRSTCTKDSYAATRLMRLCFQKLQIWFGLYIEFFYGGAHVFRCRWVFLKAA
eukprot:675821_1